MKKRHWLSTGLLGLSLLFPLYTQAITLNAYLEVRKLLKVEHPSNEKLASVTQAYLNGIANGFNFYAVSVKITNEGKDFDRLYCPPPKEVQNADFLVKHVDNYLVKYPEVKKTKGETPIELIYLLSLQDAYPCH